MISDAEKKLLAVLSGSGSPIIHNPGVVIDELIDIENKDDYLDALKEKTKSKYEKLGEPEYRKKYTSVDLLIRIENHDKQICNEWEEWAKREFDMSANVIILDKEDFEDVNFYNGIRRFWIPQNNALIYFYKP